MVTRVKICGLTRREDAELAIDLGVHALGFNFEPSSKRYLPEVPDWITEVPPYVARVAVFGPAPEAFEDPRFEAAQGEGWTSRGRLRQIEVVRCGLGLKPRDVIANATNADAMMLDARVEGQYGGTGRLVDWDLAAEVVSLSPKPVILAGGLTPENVADAIRKVRPYAVDLSSGVESSPGIKDPSKMKAFFAAVSSTWG